MIAYVLFALLNFAALMALLRRKAAKDAGKTFRQARVRPSVAMFAVAASLGGPLTTACLVFIVVACLLGEALYRLTTWLDRNYIP